MNASATLVEPAYRSVPEWDRSYGDEVADLCELAGFVPDAEQRLILDAIFALDRQNRPVAFETAVVACRQNLKTGVFKMAALGWLFVLDERLVVWSAHEFRTAQEAFRDLVALVEGAPFLSKRVKAIRRANGEEAIELADDRRLIFKARTKGGGRGLTGDKVILDEAFALQPMHMGALLPTVSARPDPQVVYGSSAGLVESDVLRGIRDRGRAGLDRRLAYFEWCAPPPAEVCAEGDGCSHALSSEGCGCDDPANWRLANPALGRRISVENIAAERRALPPAEFARERMGWWDDPLSGVSLISVEQWTTCADSSSRMVDPVAFGVDVRPDLSAAVIAAAGRRDDGRGHGEIVEQRPGTGWLVERLLELAERWNPCVVVIDPAGAAGGFLKELTEKGFATDPGPDQRRLQVMSAREYAQACVGLVSDVVNGRWRHLDQPALNAAVEGARKRDLADAWAWTRKDSTVDISPLVAVTLARHGHATVAAQRPAPAPFVLT